MIFFLSILKMIGCVLLFLLALLLVLLFYLLFLPLHYELFVKNEPESDIAFYLKGYGFLKFWQFGMEKIQGEYLLTIRGFWGKWRLLPKKEKSIPKKEKNFDDDKKIDGLSQEDIEEILADEKPEENQKIEENKKHIDSKQTEAAKKSAFKKKKRKKKTETQGFSFKEFHNKWKDEHNKNAAKFLLNKMIWLLKKMKPTILCADIDFSLGDPAASGMATGVISLCPGAYGKKTRIIPNFESEKIYVNGWIQIKGIVFLIHIVYLIISILLNKECRMCLKK